MSQQQPACELPSLRVDRVEEKMLVDLLADREKRSLAYVSYQDIHSLETFREQTIFAVRAPAETSLDILLPMEDSAAVHMKSTTGPIDVYDLPSNETSDGVGTSSSESAQPEYPYPEKEEDPPEQSEELLEVKTNGM
uniref:E2F transcription factor CC-MB domain-containing protein n=1 Tax=Capra hircus TaxID=9925 RepID=A0A8C2XZF5_CAPHI